MSYTPTTSKTHAALVKALAGLSGQKLRTREIRKRVEALAPELGKNIQWLRPTDHCDNHTCRGACTCTQTDAAPLTWLARGHFLVR